MCRKVGGHFGVSFVSSTILEGFEEGRTRAKDTRLPITPYALRRIKAALDRDPLRDIMLWVACCLGFAFWRLGEMTSPSGINFDPE